MALKEVRSSDAKAAQGKKAPAKGIDRGEALFELLLGEDVTGLSRRLKVFVAPLQAIKGKEKLPRTELHKIAKQFVPFLVRILKLCFVNAAKMPSGEAQGRGDEVFTAVEIALDGLDALRSFIVGFPFEIEMQRCSFVRRLLAWRRNSAALVQCRKNYSSLCLNFDAYVKKVPCKQTLAGAVKAKKCAVATVTEKTASGQAAMLPHPEDVELTPEIATLVSGVVTDLIWCTGESAPTAAESYHELLSLPRLLEPWLGTLDADAAGKQKDILYKGLYKCVSVLMANPSHYGDHLVREFSMLTLKYCAASPSWELYFKVAYKISRSLSYRGADSIRLGLDVSQAAMKASQDNIELQSLWVDTDALELVDCYAWLCQRGKYSAEGWAYLRELVYHVKRLFPPIAAIVGFYIIGLKFCSDIFDFDTACHDLLRAGAEIMESCLLPQIEEDRRKYTFGLLKAFEMIKKNSSKYVQGVWGSSIADGKAVTTASETVTFNSNLRRVLHLWYLLLRRASDFKKLTCGEESILKQGWSLASAPVVSLLRLSLMSLQGVQDCATCMDDLLKRGNLPVDELRWIMASASNMGIQIYSNKDYETACYPLKVACDAAWARIDVTMMQSHPPTADNQVNDFILDSCGKCVKLADSLKRSGKMQAGFDVLSDGLLRWARIHSAWQPHSTTAPSTLVHIWVKTLHIGDSGVRKSFTQDYVCLHRFLIDRCHALHLRTIGVLLEEELIVLHDLEDQGLGNIQTVKELNLQSLLDNVYTVDEYPVERCRILLEKGRLALLRGVYDFASFSEVITVLSKTLKEVLEKAADETQIANVENQLAMAHCAHAFCAYELDPAGQEYLQSIFSALSVWEVSARAGRTWIGLDVNGDARMFGQTACCGLSLLRSLLSVNDLLALKGYSLVQYRVQQLIVSFLSSARTELGPKLFASLWANTRLSHMLCLTPYPSGFFASLTQKLGVAGNSLQFWEECALLCPGTSLDAQLRFINRHFESEAFDTNVCKAEECRAFEAVERTALSLLRAGPKFSGGVIKLAVLFHILAEYAMDEGKLRVACKYAKEALNLRLRLVREYKKGAPTEPDSAETEVVGHSKNKSGRLHILDSVAARAWPQLSAHSKPVDFKPSPWRVLGDYVESLMQMGVISEKMGAVDDALANFSEGYSVSLSQNLPLALAKFKSCLGEVRRKRHQWEAAQDDLLQAKGAYDNLESALVCSCCCLTGRAVVSLRLGDFARRYIQGENPALEGVVHHHDALPFYVAAQESLAAVLIEVNEGCGCSACIYLRSTEGDTDKMPLPRMPVTAGSEAATESENHRLICMDSRSESTVMDLAATLSSLNLKQSEGNNEATKVPVVRKSRRKPINDTDPVQSKLMEKRSTRSARLKTQDTDKMQYDASSKVVSMGQSVNAGKLFRKRTVSKRSKVETQEIIVIDDDPIADSKHDEVTPVELDGQVSCASSTSGTKEPMSCVVGEAILSSIDKWTAYKWIKYCHQQLARTVLQIGKYHVEVGDPDNAVGMFEHASYFLGIQAGLLNPCSEYASYSFTRVRKSFFPLEEATLLYHKSLLHLRKIQSSGSEGIRMEFVLPMNWLVHAYSLSTQAPPLLRRISGLLSILHVPIVCGGLGLLHDLDSSCMRERAAYFHQIAIGAAGRQQHLAVLDSKLLSLVSVPEESVGTSLTQCILEMQKALAVAPLDLPAEDLSISRLVKGLPSNTLCCVSLVERELASLVKQRELLDGLSPKETSVWILITRYSDTVGPLSVLLPANSLADGEEHLSETSGSNSNCPYSIDEPQDLKHPSASASGNVLLSGGRSRFQTSLQDVASVFTSILEESRLSTSGDLDIDTVEEKRQWWRWRLALDTRLLHLLKSMENTWLGHWKCLLVAEPDSSPSQESLQIYSEELGSWLRTSYGIRSRREGHWNSYDDLVRTLLQSVGSLSGDQVKEGISTLHKWMETFLDQVQGSKPMGIQGRNDQRIDSKVGSEGVDRFSKAFVKVVQSQNPEDLQHGERTLTAVSGGMRRRKLRKDILVRPIVGSEGNSKEACSDERDPCGPARKSITLVLDAELQGLPWESMSVLRGFETYRMPSVGGIRALFIHQQLDSTIFSSHLLTGKRKGQAGSQLDRSIPQIKPPGTGSVAEPSVDPYNTYYVLNPSGDLAKTQQAFEDWFKENLGWEGKVGEVPTIEEYVTGLQKHDLYTYLGHGSGDQYLPERFVRKLNRCAASLLMGCSSGRFSPRGDYEPVGVPLSYLMAGCPAAIANLWDVTDGDIDRFSRFLLHKWLGTHNNVDSVTLERRGFDPAYPRTAGADPHGFKTNCTTGNNGIKCYKQLDAIKSSDLGIRSNLGSFIGEGRDLCLLPYLIGASPVYYGVPTSIIRKEVD